MQVSKEPQPTHNRGTSCDVVYDEPVLLTTGTHPGP